MQRADSSSQATSLPVILLHEEEECSLEGYIPLLLSGRDLSWTWMTCWTKLLHSHPQAITHPQPNLEVGFFVHRGPDFDIGFPREHGVHLCAQSIQLWTRWGRNQITTHGNTQSSVLGWRTTCSLTGTIRQEENGLKATSTPKPTLHLSPQYTSLGCDCLHGLKDSIQTFLGTGRLSFSFAQMGYLILKQN